MIVNKNNNTMKKISAPQRKNSRNILDAYYSHDTPEHFLCDEDIRIPLFPTVVEEASETLRFEFDLDGIVIELRTLIAVKAGLHYLFGSGSFGQGGGYKFAGTLASAKKTHSTHRLQRCRCIGLVKDLRSLVGLRGRGIPA